MIQANEEAVVRALYAVGYADAECKIHAAPGDLTIFLKVNGKSLKSMDPLPLHCAVEPSVLAERVANRIPTLIKWANGEFRDAS